MPLSPLSPHALLRCGAPLPRMLLLLLLALLHLPLPSLVIAQSVGEGIMREGGVGSVAVQVEAAGLSGAAFAVHSFAAPPPSLAVATVLPLSVVSSAVLVSSTLGFCRGFDLPGSLRVCVHPGNSLSVQLNLTAPQPLLLQRSEEEAAAARTAAMARLAVLVSAVQGEEEGERSPASFVTLAPSTLLPLHSVASPLALTSSLTSSSNPPSSSFSSSSSSSPSSSPQSLSVAVGGLVGVESSQLGIFSLAFAVAQQPGTEEGEGGAAVASPLLHLQQPLTVEIEVHQRLLPLHGPSPSTATALTW